MTIENTLSEFFDALITGNGRNSKETRKLNDLRRSNLRKLTMQRMVNDGWSEEDLIKYVNSNPRVQAGEIKFPGTFAGARDMFTNVTMTNISLGIQSEHATYAALAGGGSREHFGASKSVTTLALNDFKAVEFALGLLKSVKDFNTDITEVVESGNDLSDCLEELDSSTSLDNLITQVTLYCVAMGKDSFNTSIAEDIILSCADRAIRRLRGEAVEETTTTTTTEGTTNMQNIESFKTGIEGLADGERTIVNALLQKFNVPELGQIESNFNDLKEAARQAASGPSGVTVNVQLVDAYNGSNQSGSYPDGNMVLQKAAPLFNITGKGAVMFDFDVPTFDWKTDHPLVPEVDQFYQFNPQSLLRLLMAIIKGDMTWIFGHTGTGKSTLVEQVCARLKYPLMRVNFDSEITRMDLVGRDTLKTDANNGASITEFVEGILPQALQTPCIMLADELDAIRPDVAYVYQRVLEGNGMVLNENGGKVIKPHPWFRLVATGNSRGNGDTSGMYNAVRPQSMAMLDRFGVWVEVDYMPISSLKTLLGSKYKLTNEIIGAIAKYANEHWTAFKAGDLRQPLSPRGLQSVAEQYTFYSGLMAKEQALESAVKTAIADRAEESDAQTIAGLLQRVTGKLS